MSARPNPETLAAWRLVNRLRDICYGRLPFEEKKRLHDSVTILKGRGKLHPDDIAWLKIVYERLGAEDEAMAMIRARPSRGRGP